MATVLGDDVVQRFYDIGIRCASHVVFYWEVVEHLESNDIGLFGNAKVLGGDGPGAVGSVALVVLVICDGVGLWLSHKFGPASGTVPKLDVPGIDACVKHVGNDSLTGGLIVILVVVGASSGEIAVSWKRVRGPTGHCFELQ